MRHEMTKKCHYNKFRMYILTHKQRYVNHIKWMKIKCETHKLSALIERGSISVEYNQKKKNI